MRKTFLIFCSMLVMIILFAGCRTNSGKPLAEQSPGGNFKEQENIAANALEDYFQIALDFSKGEYDADEVFKKELKERYRKIMTGELLEQYANFVDEGNIQSDYYISAFMQEVNSQVKKVKILNSSSGTIEAEAEVNNHYEFSAMFDDFGSSTFIEDNRVVNLTQDKFTELVHQYNPTGIAANQVKKYSCKLIKEGQAWKFTKLECRIEDTELIELHTWNGKKISL